MYMRVGTESEISTMFLQLMMLCIIYSTHAQKSWQTVCKHNATGSYYYCGIMKECCYINGKLKCLGTIGEFGSWYIPRKCNVYKRSTSYYKTTTPRHLMKTTTLPAYIKTTYNRRRRTRNMNRMTIRRIGTNTQSRGFPRYTRSTTGYRYTEYTLSSKEQLFTILPAVIVVAMIIIICMCCSVYNDRKQHKMRLRNRRRRQQSRALQLTNEQQHYRIIGLYYVNGNAAAVVASPRTQLEYGADWERLVNSTQNGTTSIPTDNPPAYENIINGNTAAIDSYHPRTHTRDDEERNTNYIPNNGTITNLPDDTRYIPTNNPPPYEDIMN
ncbi:uncharacterized protein LOC127714403 isoform X1 [Mytilus californianus]|uniref:uncharacterized protein LOC127714403 isoform X1 n=1 Tax=Mytilus californianus TaxID=6549 RepID=UPI002245F80F|nr:uncharacterized protein LOC127714403 isoform X1 [Mytilus californianus]